MKQLILSIFLITSTLQGVAQNENRIQTIENQLTVLQVTTPGLEETLNINISQTSLSNFLLAISEIHSLNINVAPELGSINIINNFSNVTVRDILIFLVREYDLDIRFTGNILSINKYITPSASEKELGVYFNPATGQITLDLKNNRLERVFRKIMDDTGKNLLFSPEIESMPLTLYLKDVPFDVALSKLAETNGLLLSTSKEGFYVFDAQESIAGSGEGANAGSRPRRRIGRNFYYKILDSTSRRVEVDFQNAPVSDVIYTISDELGLSIFTASPLDNVGNATVKASSIDFDLLLNRIFESAVSSSDNTNANARGSGNTQAGAFTFRKDGNIYYFGTENQLSLKQLEVISLQNRSVNMFADPQRSFQEQLNQNFVTGGTNYGVPNQGIGGQSASRSSNQNQNEIKKESLEVIIPESIKEGLIINTDYELNSFLVSGPGVKVERLKEFIKQIDKKVPLILIEVMIMEVDRTAIVEAGVSFGLGERPSTTQGSLFPSTDVRLGADRVNRIIGGFDGFGSLNIGKVLPEFYLDIKANETNGNIKILSTPKLSALNGHKAYLSSSQTTYYAITNQTIIGTQNPQTNTITNYLPISAELALEFRPFVSGDGQITMDVRVIQSTFNGARIAEDAPPDINTREFSSILIMRDQDVAILGGIEQVIKDDTGSGVPLLARIPVLKWLFSKRRREDTKRNLSVLIKPTVIR